ncbi:MAG: LacI family DNA-binding transcriptional regulator, partial [Elstera sp.]
MSTMSDIAKAAGVSTATVSRAISTPELVSEDTRARVQAAVERLGYRPNSAARSLRTQKSTAVLVIVPEIGNPFFATIIHGIEQIALERGYTVLLGNTENDPVRERAYLEMIDARRADGLILLNGQLLRRAAGAPLPIAADLPPLVFACEYLPGTDWPTVRVDNASGA